MGVLIGSSLVFPDVDVMCVPTFSPFLLHTPEGDGFGEAGCLISCVARCCRSGFWFSCPQRYCSFQNTLTRCTEVDIAVGTEYPKEDPGVTPEPSPVGEEESSLSRGERIR